MTDKISKELRSANMRAVRSRDTEPEIRVRRIAYGLGYRFRLHRGELPGKPDLAFLGLRKAIFVHGCFWHQHIGCRRGSVPQSNVGFWRPKLARNVMRDREQLAALKEIGWRVLIIWECQIQDEDRVITRMARFLSREKASRP